jgi:cobalt-zinc-cadmium efflux system outer membrane protein
MDTVRAYLDAWRNRELLKALESNRDGLETLLRAMRARVREGYAPEADLAKFQAESARIDAQLLRTRLELDRQLAVLTALVAEPLPVSEARLVDPGDRTPPAGDPAELAKQATSRAPLVHVARARAEQATKVLALERALQRPDVYVAGGYKRTAGADTAVLGVSLSLPLFDRNQRAVAAATGDAQAAAFDAAALEASVAAEARVVFASAQALAERAGRLDVDLIAPAEIVRAAARSAFREGATDILTLVDAERVYLEAHREALQLRLDAIATAIEARLLLGEEVRQ